MTERKPSGLTFETWAERQIREATQRGDFDNVSGTGDPLRDLDKPYEDVWVQRQLRSEGLSAEALLPTPLLLRKEIERLPDTLRDVPSEHAVRDVVTELNARVLAWLRAPSGPRVPVRPVDADEVVRQWRADRSARAPEAAAARDSGTPEAAAGTVATTGRAKPRHRWWRSRTPRRQSM